LYFCKYRIVEKNEENQVVKHLKKNLKINLIYVNAEKEFLKN
jgi:GMP synthase (glutamine-hydrolysing)